jgi:hypothetical protein
MADANVAPLAVTPKTRPPFVTSPVESSFVPAWKTVAPVASASAMPWIGLPVGMIRDTRPRRVRRTLLGQVASPM